jgi:hypothetical protein
MQATRTARLPQCGKGIAARGGCGSNIVFEWKAVRAGAVRIVFQAPAAWSTSSTRYTVPRAEFVLSAGSHC